MRIFCIAKDSHIFLTKYISIFVKVAFETLTKFQTTSPKCVSDEVAAAVIILWLGIQSGCNGLHNRQSVSMQSVANLLQWGRTLSMPLIFKADNLRDLNDLLLM